MKANLQGPLRVLLVLYVAHRERMAFIASSGGIAANISSNTLVLSSVATNRDL